MVFAALKKLNKKTILIEPKSKPSQENPKEDSIIQDVEFEEVDEMLTRSFISEVWKQFKNLTKDFTNESEFVFEAETFVKTIQNAIDNFHEKEKQAKIPKTLTHELISKMVKRQKSKK